MSRALRCPGSPTAPPALDWPTGPDRAPRPHRHVPRWWIRPDQRPVPALPRRVRPARGIRPRRGGTATGGPTADRGSRLGGSVVGGPGHRVPHPRPAAGRLRARPAAVGDPSTWTVTTHDWAVDVDRDHLAHIRDDCETYGAGGRRHLILEVLAYANEEAEHLGRIHHATVVIRPNGVVAVTDDGRGTDTRTDSNGRIVRKPVMATRDVRFFDVPDCPALPDGPPRRGMSIVAALSANMVHDNHRPRGAWSQAYHHGVPDDALCAIPASDTTGTSVTFQADLAGA